MRRGGFSFWGSMVMGEDGGGFGEEKNRKLGDKLQITFLVCCVVKAGGFQRRGLWGQQQLHSGLCPHVRIGWCWLTVGPGEYTFKGQDTFFFSAALLKGD